MQVQTILICVTHHQYLIRALPANCAWRLWMPLQFCYRFALRLNRRLSSNLPFVQQSKSYRSPCQIWFEDGYLHIYFEHIMLLVLYDLKLWHNIILNIGQIYLSCVSIYALYIIWLHATFLIKFLFGTIHNIRSGS